jgi:phosphoribosyl 1,2-cyclic phosphodiesterase
MFDMGTGARYFGAAQAQDGSFDGVCLLTHLHWDHTQGLPFFTPMLRDGAQLDLYAPYQEDGRTVAEVFEATVRPPLFPVSITQFPGEFRFHDLSDSEFDIGSGPDRVHVTSRLVPHVGPTLGYRVEWRGLSVAYLSDHQQPYDGGFRASEGALELADGVDLLIHDSQYTAEEFALKYNWGHCTMDYAVWFATKANAKRLALFHHDPTRTDAAIDALAECAVRVGRHSGLEVLTSREGMVVDLS